MMEWLDANADADIITFKDAVAHDVSTFNYYKWHTATAVITY